MLCILYICYNVIRIAYIYIYIHCIYGCITASMTVHNVFHVSQLKKYVPDANHIIDWTVIQVEPDGFLQVHHVRILDRKRKQLRNRAIELVKV